MKKLCDIFMLPTEKKSHIMTDGIGIPYYRKIACGMIKDDAFPLASAQHLYFVCNDKIKGGDWYLDTLNGGVCQHGNGMPVTTKCFTKIIATTDASMHYKPNNGYGFAGSDFDKDFDVPKIPMGYITDYVWVKIKPTQVLVEFSELKVCPTPTDCRCSAYDASTGFCRNAHLMVDRVKTNSNNEISIFSASDELVKDGIVVVKINGKKYETIVTEEGVQYFPTNKLIRYLVDSKQVSLQGLWDGFENGTYSMMELVEFYIGMGYTVLGLDELFGDSSINIEEDKQIKIENPLW